MIEAIEDSDVLASLREDAERYRHLRMNFGIALPDDDGTVVWYPDEIDRVVDKSRHDTPPA